MLTERQLRAFDFIDARLQRDGVAPSYAELAAALDLKSKSAVLHLLAGLEERGFIRRLPRRARALEVVKRPRGLPALGEDGLTETDRQIGRSEAEAARGGDAVAQAVAAWWGERCPDYAQGCACCDAWAAYDAMRPPPTPARPRMAARLRLSRAKGWRKPEGAVVVARPTPWGNPFVVGKDGTAAECVHLYSLMCAGRLCLTCEAGAEEQRRALAHAKAHLADLRGRDLLCWCRLDKPCHADVLIELANSEAPDLSRFLLRPLLPARL